MSQPSKGSRRGALVYVRVSTDEQAEHGYSLDSQEATCRAFAGSRGLDVLGVFREEGESATTSARPRLRELLAACVDDERVGHVVVLHTDRFARNVLDHLTLKAHLARHGVGLLSVQQPHLDDSPEGALMDTILASLNEFYSRDIGRKVAKNMAQKAAEGGYPRCAPIGYRNRQDDRRDEKWIEPDPVAAPAVTDAFTRFAEGSVTAAEIARFMFERGIRARTGRAPAIQTVLRMLRNPAYLGKVPWKGQVMPGKHPALTDPETFAACQRVLVERNRGADRARKHQFLLANLVRCAICDGVLTGEHHRKRSGREFAYYRCLGHRRGSGCDDRYVRAEVLEEGVRRAVLSPMVTDRFRAALRVTLEELLRDRKTTQSKQVKALGNRRLALEQKLRAVEARVIDGTLSPARAKTWLNELTAELDLVGQQLQREKGPDILPTREDVEALVAFVGRLEDLLLGPSVRDQRRVLRSLVRVVHARRGHVTDVEPTPELAAVLSLDLVRMNALWSAIRDLVRTSSKPGVP